MHRRRRSGRAGRTASWALLASFAAAPAAFGQQPQLPPVAAAPSQEHHVGKVILLELITPDLAAAERFYGGVFGWSFHGIALGHTQYAEALLNGRLVAGLIQRAVPKGEQHHPAWLGFFSVNDVDAAGRVAQQSGAKLLFGPRTFAGRGREAVLADPQGAVFALLAASGGDPSDALAGPGEWIWSSLITSDPTKAADFYRTLFQFNVTELPATPGATHLLLTTGNYARATVNTLPPNAPHVRPAWLNFVRVEDVDATTAKAVSFGGRVLVQPHDDPLGGKLALIADPGGAPFGILEWPADRTKMVSPR